MPYSEKQRRLAGADLQRKRQGKPTRTGMTTAQLKDFASKPVVKKKAGRKK